MESIRSLDENKLKNAFKQKLMIRPLVLVLLVTLSSADAYLSISEVMYNPQGSDNNKEYIEIYTNITNLTNYIIEDLKSFDIIKEVQIINSSFALIVEDSFNYSDINASIYSVGATIGNGLNNDRDLIILRSPNNSILDATLYTDNIGGNGNNMSLCIIEFKLAECISTPGFENSFINETFNYRIKINEFMPNPAGYDNSSMPNGEWIELYNEEDLPINLEGLKLIDNANHSIEVASTNVISASIIEPNDYLVIYMNGGLLLNNDGFEKIFLKYNDFIIDEVSYSNSKEDVSWSKINNLFVFAQPTPGSQNPPEIQDLGSKVEIEKIYTSDGKVKFGESVKVRLKVLKGDTNKREVKVYIKDLTKQTTFNVFEKFKDDTITIPLQITPNCDNKYKEGKYEIIAEGLDTEDKESVKIEGFTKSLCKEIKTEKKEEKETNKSSNIKLKAKYKAPKPNLTESIINNQHGFVYESSDAKAKRYAIYFFCLVLIFIIAYQHFGREENG